MESIYFYCSVVGGAVLVIQTILLLIGLDGGDTDTDFGAPEADVDADGSDAFFKILSIKTLTAFVTFFGLGGMAAGQAGAQPAIALLVAIGAGSVALYLVASLMSGLAKLQAKGNVEIENAVGTTGTVYLKIPAEHHGAGKVTLEIQGRSLQVKAVTGGPELPTGSAVTVVRKCAADTLEVVANEG